MQGVVYQCSSTTFLRRSLVLDVIYLALGAALFGVTVAYTAACDRL